MNDHSFHRDTVKRFAGWLRTEERSPGTIANYLRCVGSFSRWLAGRTLTKEAVSQWRDWLIARGYCPGSVNGMIVALNQFFDFAGRHDLRIKCLRVQRRLFREDRRELTQLEYQRLLTAAERKGQERLCLLMETICATGIRVSELQYITVEAAGSGYAEVTLKGKVRTIFLPGKLCRKLLRYAKKKRTASGAIFCTKSGKTLSRKQIWSEMKCLCAEAGVAASKVFPHNLRHLFARIFYKLTRDIVRLADVLGHSSVETTRIYLISTGREHARLVDRLGLIG